MTKNKGGRPTKMTDKTVNKLEEAFRWGCTDAEACLYADITKKTLYNYCDKNEAFIHRKELLKDQPILKSKEIQSAELEKNSINQANIVINRKEGQKIDVTTKGKRIHNNFIVQPVTTDA
ncbi:hypothetical protein KAR91_46585 [Candidatus Pacearchaeota archaeon]|nr:hypothetical protein [Candidatus Pacearchaeota archaeon]